MVETETLLVVNRGSGNGVKEIPVQQITEIWPTSIAVLSFEEMFTKPETIPGKKVVGWGGDGTHGYLAELARRNQAEWYMPLDLGSIGDIPKTFGWKRKPGENIIKYLSRVAESAGRGVTVTEIDPGSFESRGKTGEFLWTAGAGAGADLLSAVENARKWGWKQLPRSVYGITEFMKATTKSAINLYFPDEEYFQAIDVNVVNRPFARLGSMTLPTPGGVTWWIEKTDESKIWNQSLRIAMDVLMMKTGKPPVFEGVKLKAMRKEEPVIIQGKKLNAHIDSEIVPGETNEMILTIGKSHELKYRIAANRTKPVSRTNNPG